MTISSRSSSEEFFFVNAQDKSTSKKYANEVIFNGRKYKICKETNMIKKKKENQKCSCQIL